MTADDGYRSLGSNGEITLSDDQVLWARVHGVGDTYT